MAEREKLQISKGREAELEKIGAGKSLAAALARVILRPYTYRAEWDQALKQHFGKPVAELGSLEDFYDAGVRKAVAQVTSPSYAETVRELLSIRMEGIYSDSIYRRSLHGDSFYLYADAVEMTLASLARFYQYGVTVEEALKRNHDDLQAGLSLLFAGEIRHGNKEIVETIRDAIYQDAPEVPISRTIIRAVLYSGDEGLIADLLKLLLAARLQEGLRQAILENADCGRPEVLARILAFTVEYDLLRYSSAMRAFMTWIGLAYAVADQKTVRAYAEIALRALTDPDKRAEYLKSSNHLELYFALWATGVYRVEDVDPLAAELLRDPAKHRRVVGWFFVHELDSVRTETRYAGGHLDEPEEEVRAWIVRCYATTHSLSSAYYMNARDFVVRAEANEALPQTREERRRHYYAFRQYYLDLGGKKKEFAGNPFPFSRIQLDGVEVLKRMFSLAGYDMDPELVADLMGLTPEMPADGKTAMLLHFLQPEEPAQRALLRELLKDRAVTIKELAVRRLQGTALESEDLMALTECLRTKSADLRKSILAVLTGQDREVRAGLIRALLRDPENNRLMAGLELLLDEEAKEPGTKDHFRDELAGLDGDTLSPEAAILLRRLTAREEEYTPENGFGLYDPALTARIRQEAAETAPAAAASAEPAPKKGLLGRLFAGKAADKQEADLLDLKAIRQRIILTDEEVVALLAGMNDVFERYATEEYVVENWDGSRETMLFGSCNRFQLLVYPKKNERKVEFRFDQIPHAEEFRTAIQAALAGRHDRLPALLFTTGRGGVEPGWGMKWQDWFLREIRKAGIDMNCHKYGYDHYGQRYWNMVAILEHCAEWLTGEDLPELLRIYRSLVHFAGEGRLGEEVTEPEGNRTFYGSRPGEILMNCRFLSAWRQILRGMELSAEGFAGWFRLEYRLEALVGRTVLQGLRIEDFLRAFRDGIIPMDCLYERLLSSVSAKDDIRLLTATQANDRKRAIERDFPFTRALTGTAVDRVLTIEEKRGELPTAVSGIAAQIVRFTGGEHFVKLLTAMGKDGFFRGYSYASDTTKKNSLSRLIKASFPATEDTPERMRDWLRAAGLSPERAAEAAMYAPQWARLLEKAIDWPGLTSAVWFYHAHVSEHFSAEKETEVALHSRFTPEEFNDGAFDADWYREAVATIGEKRFRFLYKAAKYITSTGSYHRRSQLFVDAVSGRLDADGLEAEIRDKRNQEKLRAYPLIPVKDEEEILHRYLFLEEFRKGSHAFGALRRESEKKAYQAALRNLAVTAGVSDTNRLIWRMETRSFAQMETLFMPREVDGIRLRLSLPEEGGKASLVVEKDGKVQKTLPKALAKDPFVAELKEAQKALADQYRRSRRTLEQAMTDRSAFGTEELQALLSHPVIAPLLKALLWVGEKEEAACCPGFLSLAEGALWLTDELGERHAAETFGTLRIAHPYDLMRTGTWSAWLRVLMEQRIVQPFKQAAREYYPLTDEEREERTVSRRYAGYQVQPKQFFGALKARGWTADYEEGLQKVVHGRNVVIRLYAAADWFSPADIEPPTLEQVEFYDRRSGETLPLADLDPVLFSETMRDLDMAVSVAYAGGVDPEASHSTVEMRRAILEELLALLKVRNVAFLPRHARVTGDYGTYTVHLGSGIVHMEGRGMIPILAVPSQTRGRVFLPFADDDPKTAEIVSKVLLLAQDKSIKDPAILARIR